MYRVFFEDKISAGNFRTVSTLVSSAKTGKTDKNNSDITSTKTNKDLFFPSVISIFPLYDYEFNISHPNEEFTQDVH